MRFLLLAVKFFIQEYKEIFSLIQSRKGVYSPKKVLVVSLIIFNKGIVIYYKFEVEGLPSKKSFLRLLANKTKKYLFEGLKMQGQGEPSKRYFFVSLARRRRKLLFEDRPSTL